MEHTATLTRYITQFVDQLSYSGVEDVVISPGSRSTPLAMTFREHGTIKHWMNLDERSAAFFALGIAKDKQKPVALVCTSGTAAANYYPAIVEAYYSRVPLLVFTADRPHELRDVGAPQSIEQSHMYGNYVKWFHDLALPEDRLLPYVRKQASRAVHESTSGHAGPVHLNIPLREPLVPDFSTPGCWRGEIPPVPVMINGSATLNDEQIRLFKERLLSGQKGLIVCGPQSNGQLPYYIAQLASKAGLPILADPLSQLRAGEHDKRNVIESYDALLRSEAFKDHHIPDYIIRFGAMPISKAYLKWIQKHSQDVEHFVVDEYASHREPSGVPTTFVFSHPAEFCEQIGKEIGEDGKETEWLSEWKSLNVEAKKIMLASPEPALNEGHAVVYLSEAIPEESNLFVGNSMPVREVDNFFAASPKKINIMANRGANGIDGVVSTALGAAAHGKNTTLLLGDLSFFHDLNGLLIAKQKKINITIVVINNDGGGIFSYLPQASNSEHFEELFGTPIGVDFEKVVSMYEGSHRRAINWESYKEALRLSYKEEGLSVVEVMTDRDSHVAFHQSRWSEVADLIEGWKC
ncbi:2-succinyl-5-enolpyruvyl-6-hydroxy-3-cyclohexene-1-carboxylate synthase [Halobacillus andaensis]|uniref:2-succinyl-5-enolpyruvyl-6-hydroxy-3-cyclohexene-1-carboxylate synthase n=1 Tax=Halobacillus andaensis TaxID=1176239 RepID=A0A917BAK5_HALAA|nr:2-succinyl-5-enolpyruvyl-6-hydroxy-3-cyclohexene-1-carboxylic-acid synthase [Halobacillus andaensis]MBP2005617.1 2-succinyl-5-enolpyruvyl-6-hydroxy-3-cyclohexene-1-carboxylate synthase [Halobacillus andaensis]GGF32914.1 2-succinyl-5-enolpyruvyl-6-hydroxy-3-cyclohexene-1-carboxylate synthase [Halobacillus andaensis]